VTYEEEEKYDIFTALTPPRNKFYRAFTAAFLWN